MNNIDTQKALERSYVSSLENKEYNEAVKVGWKRFAYLILIIPNTLIKLLMFICNN